MKEKCDGRDLTPESRAWAFGWIEVPSSCLEGSVDIVLGSGRVMEWHTESKTGSL